MCSDLAKRVEEEATGAEDGEGALEPEAQFSLDSLDIIKVAHQYSAHWKTMKGMILKYYLG